MDLLEVKMTEKITFSFGKNWMNFSEKITKNQIKSALYDLKEWMGEDKIVNKNVLDIGSGSGVHSLAFLLLGANKVESFDNDLFSVNATRILWENQGKPKNWEIFQGSILDKNFLNNLKKYDIVYSWGVLHHTGEMWNAITNAASLVKPDGYFFISIYAKGPNYENDLKLKKKYNSSNKIKKLIMEQNLVWRRRILGSISVPFIPRSFKEFKQECGLFGWRIKNIRKFEWNEQKTQGMDMYHDIVDWLGGLPYEVADADEIVTYCIQFGLKLEKIHISKECGCSIYLFHKSNFNS